MAFCDLLPRTGRLPSVALTLMAIVAASRGRAYPAVESFAPGRPLRPHPSTSPASSSATSLPAINRRNKFNKQKELAAKMAEAKRRRELTEGGVGSPLPSSASAASPPTGELTPEEIELRNDRRRFADMLDKSMSSGGDLDKGYYLTVEQENENADAVYKGVVRLYEGDPAPTAPFAELLSIENGEPIGKGGAKRLLPWEGSLSAASVDYLIVVTDPRPKSVELRTAIKRLAGALSGDLLKRCLVINTDTPAETRRFLKKNNLEGLKVMCDENLEWMREYTALGEKRFSITMFVLGDGRVQKIAREVEAEVLPMVIKNAIRPSN